ncbi:MAG: hypothetical protein RIF41_02440 [Polyangiaceae bacterium]
MNDHDIVPDESDAEGPSVDAEVERAMAEVMESFRALNACLDEGRRQLAAATSHNPRDTPVNLVGHGGPPGTATTNHDRGTAKRRSKQ